MFCGGCTVCMSGAEHSWKLKFIMQTYLTHVNIILEYCHASVVLENVDVLYLEDGNVCRLVLKNSTTTMVSENTFSSYFKLCINKHLNFFFVVLEQCFNI